MGILRLGTVLLSVQLGLEALALSTGKLFSRYDSKHIVNETVCDHGHYQYRGLAGYGLIPSNARDKFGDTIGGIGSAIALERKSWKKTKGGDYTGILWGLTDRGWNTQGTLNYQTRVHKFCITFTPKPDATVAHPCGPNLQLKYLDTVLFTGPDGTPTTSLDPDAAGHITYPGFPELPVATYPGDGFGHPGPGGKRIPIDGEGLVLNADGGFWVSDEYGPYIYKFSATGRMERAIAPPGAFLPQRNGSTSFSADSPPIYDPTRIVIPADTVSGRNNNQGFEGVAVTDGGHTLYALMQSALDQEGGPNNPFRRQARLVEYDISHSDSDPRYVAEYVVTLPLWTDPTASPDKATKVAAQSSIEALGDGVFLILARDSGAGHGQSSSLSIYRHADIFSISSNSDATNIKSSTNDAVGAAIASKTGVLNPGIKAATYCSFLDFNLNSELGKFGLHNGGAQDQMLLNEKWESLALAPIDGEEGKDGEWFLISMSDNDFITQDGHFQGGAFKYADKSGYNLDNQVLVFDVTLPKSSTP